MQHVKISTPRRFLLVLLAVLMIFFSVPLEGQIKATAADMGSLIVSNYRFWIKNELPGEAPDYTAVKDGDSISLAIDWRIRNN